MVGIAKQLVEYSGSYQYVIVHVPLTRVAGSVGIRWVIEWIHSETLHELSGVSS